MKLSVRAWIEIALAVAVLVGGIIFFEGWMSEHDARLKAETTITEQKKAFDQASAQMKALEDADLERSKQTAAAVAAIQATAAKQVTPEQIATWIPKQLPGPVPITLTVPAATPSNPHPDAVASIPQSDLPALRDEIASCQTCAVKLTASTQDAASKAEQLRVAGEQLSAAEKERDAYKTALAGGTKWQRIKAGGKWILYGAGGAVVAVCVTGHCK
jgi:hypothetical protein